MYFKENYFEFSYKKKYIIIGLKRDAKIFIVYSHFNLKSWHFLIIKMLYEYGKQDDMNKVITGRDDGEWYIKRVQHIFKGGGNILIYELLYKHNPYNLFCELVCI